MSFRASRTEVPASSHHPALRPAPTVRRAIALVRTAVEVDGELDVGSGDLAQGGEGLDRVVDETRRLRDERAVGDTCQAARPVSVHSPWAVGGGARVGSGPILSAANGDSEMGLPT